MPRQVAHEIFDLRPFDFRHARDLSGPFVEFSLDSIDSIALAQ